MRATFYSELQQIKLKFNCKNQRIMLKQILTITMFLCFTSWSIGQSNWFPPFEVEHNNDAIEIAINNSVDCSQGDDYDDKYNRYQFYLDNYDKHPVVTIPININFWQQDDGSGNWQNTPASIARLDQIVAWLNGYYDSNCPPSDPIAGVPFLNDTKIRFEAKYYFYQNSAVWSTTSGSTLNAAVAAIDPERLNQLNIHVNGGVYPGAWGLATYPSTNIAYHQYVVTFNNEANPGADYAWAGHLAHELGHTLDLRHTYGGANCNETSPDYLADVFNYGPCPHESGWCCDVYSSSNTCTNNMMGGTKYSCYFSPMQIARMHRALSLKSIRKYVKCEPFDADPIVVDTDEQWDFNIKLYNPVQVTNGANLTLSCHLEMSNYDEIIVEDGSRLTVDGGTITSECPYWGGIELWGNANLTQNPLNQGVVETKNEAIIENARRAITTIKGVNSGWIWSKTGGIIKCTNTTFRNNWNSCAYLYYHAQHPFLANVEIPNQGRFVDCDFIWDDEFLEPNPAPAITMYHVNGVQIAGCDFMDERSVPASEKATGIFTLDAGFKVRGKYLGAPNPFPTTPLHWYDELQTDYQHSYFKDLKYGIQAMNNNTSYSVLIDQSRFENNSYGILLDAIDDAIITRNWFEFNNMAPAAMNSMFELSLRECSGYKVEGNTFNKFSNPWGAAGTLVENSGPQANEVFRNKYEGVNVGNWARGFNSNDLSSTQNATGLQWLCNENLNGYYDLLNDIPFYDPTLNGEGVRLLQGDMDKAAGNTFSPTITPPGQHLYHDDQDWMVYFYSTQSNEMPTEITGPVALSEAPPNQCPSSFATTIAISSGNFINATALAALETRLDEIDEKVRLKTTELDALLQAGDASSLHALVTNLNNSNKHSVKATLLQESPYLSKNLLEELGLKQPSLFPHSWYREVINANIEVARDESFMDFLSNKPYPMPTGMYSQIKDDRFREFTERGEKELEILALNDEREVIINLLISNAMAGEDEIDWNYIRQLIIDRDHIECRRQLIDYHMSRLEINRCNDELDLLELQLGSFEMDRVKAELEDFVFFKRYMLSITGNTGIVKALQPLEISELEYMASNFEGKAARQARNVLCFYEGLCDDIDYEIPTAPNNGNRSMQFQEEENSDFMQRTLLIKPNPNQGEFAIEIPSNCAIQTIAIVDVTGRAVAHEVLASKENMARIKLLQPKSGVHIIVATCANGKRYMNRTLITN